MNPDCRLHTEIQHLSREDNSVHFLVPVHTSCPAGLEITLNKDIKERKEKKKRKKLDESHGWMRIVRLGGVPEGVFCGQPRCPLLSCVCVCLGSRGVTRRTIDLFESATNFTYTDTHRHTQLWASHPIKSVRRNRVRETKEKRELWKSCGGVLGWWWVVRGGTSDMLNTLCVRE